MEENKQFLPGVQGENREYKVGNKHPPLETRFEPGQSGNPGGRPKDRITLTPRAREKLLEICPHDKNKTWLEYLVDCWLSEAADNPRYFAELIERLEGKIPTLIGGAGEDPILVSVIEKIKDYGASQKADK